MAFRPEVTAPHVTALDEVAWLGLAAFRCPRGRLVQQGTGCHPFAFSFPLLVFSLRTVLVQVVEMCVQFVTSIWNKEIFKSKKKKRW